MSRALRTKSNRLHKLLAESKREDPEKMKTSDRKCTVAMPSITYAMHGESALSGAAIPVKVVKLAAGATKKGCAYGLELSCGSLERAVNILEKNGIKHGEIL